MRHFILSALLLILLSFALPAIAEMHVSRAVLCSGVEDLEPVETVENVTADMGQIYFFAEIKEAGEESQIKHIWYYNDDPVAEIPITVSGPRWRTYSYKALSENMTGEWHVDVVDENGNVLQSVPFTVK
ncbi:MAG: DUF2914 domain-containing protein [candidate division Zixibacteria bacterium]|nr:DUF2914 domain-containing protein [candidate division Zixibacteria bacterium]